MKHLQGWSVGRHCVWLIRTALAAVVLVFATPSVAGSAFTTEACLAQKRTAWGALRQCQANEAAKAVKGKASEPAKCQTRFATRLAKSDAKAAKAAIPCRYGDNGDGTVTDYDSGLQWEKKTGAFPFPGMLGFCSDPDIHCVLDLYDWSAAHTFVSVLNGTAFFPSLVIENRFAEFSDWRLPTIDELRAIVAPDPLPEPRLDPIFGPTAPDVYWSGTQYTDEPDRAYGAGFSSSNGLLGDVKTQPYYVRAVRSAF